MIEPVKKDLHNVMADKLTAADATFKDSINRLVNSQVCDNKNYHTQEKHARQKSHGPVLIQKVLNYATFQLSCVLKSCYNSVVLCFKIMVHYSCPIFYIMVCFSCPVF